jgi:carbon storage regulator
MLLGQLSLKGAAMLVLSRKPGEKLMIGDNIVVTILSVQGPKVKVGLEAPQGVSIRREELRPLAGQQEANSTEGPSLPVERLAPIS